jgi:hypothetical protein
VLLLPSHQICNPFISLFLILKRINSAQERHSQFRLPKILVFALSLVSIVLLRITPDLLQPLCFLNHWVRSRRPGLSRACDPYYALRVSTQINLEAIPFVEVQLRLRSMLALHAQILCVWGVGNLTPLIAIFPLLLTLLTFFTFPSVYYPCLAPQHLRNLLTQVLETHICLLSRVRFLAHIWRR